MPAIRSRAGDVTSGRCCGSFTFVVDFTSMTATRGRRALQDVDGHEDGILAESRFVGHDASIGHARATPQRRWRGKKTAARSFSTSF